MYTILSSPLLKIFVYFEILIYLMAKQHTSYIICLSLCYYFHFHQEIYLGDTYPNKIFQKTVMCPQFTGTILSSPYQKNIVIMHWNAFCLLKMTYIIQGFPQVLRTWGGCTSPIGGSSSKFDVGKGGGGLESIHWGGGHGGLPRKGKIYCY